MAIVDDHERSRADVRAAVWAAGGEVAGEATRCADALPLVARCGPDVAVFAVGLPDGDGIEAAGRVTAAATCPVVLLTSRTGEGLIERARAAGVMGYLLKPLRRPELAPALDLAVARFREARALQRRLEERKLIERAKGLLMRRYHVSEDDAFRRLRRTAMDRRTTMAEVARALLDAQALADAAVPARLSR